MRPPRSDSGFSLIEALGALALLTLIVGFLHAILGLSAAAGTDGMRQSRLQVEAQRALGRLRRDLRRALPGTLVVTDENGSSRVDFDVATGVDVDGTVLTVPVCYRWEPGTLDDDGDGFPDTGLMTRTEGGRGRVMCRGIPRGGFEVARTLNLVTIALDLVSRRESGKALRMRLDGEVTLRE